MTEVAAENLEAQEAWDGVLFDRFLLYRDLVVPALAALGEKGIRRCPPEPGDSILDVGCGFGDSTQDLARLSGPSGSALGVDIAPRFIERAQAEAAEAGVENVRFEACDLQATEFEETFDYVYSRFGTMFFDNPVPAFRNVRRAIAPGGRLCIVVWRRREDNPWLYVAENVVKPGSRSPRRRTSHAAGPAPSPRKMRTP